MSRTTRRSTASCIAGPSPRSCGEGIEPLAQGGIHVAAIAKGLVERMEDWSGHLQVRLLREGRPWHGERGRRLAISSRTSLTSRCASAAPFELRVARCTV